MFFAFAKQLRSRFLRPALLGAALAAFALQAAAQGVPSTSSVVAAESPTSAVVIDGKTLFSVRGLSAYPADKRAENIAGAIVAVASDSAIAPASVTLVETPAGTKVVAANRTIITVVDADAQLEGIDRSVMAEATRVRIVQAIEEFRHDRDPSFLARQAFHALGATLAFAVVVVCLRRLTRSVHSTLQQRYRGRIRGVGIQSFEIIRADQLWRMLEVTIHLVGVLALLIATYLYTHYVLSLFPWTYGLANSLLAVALSPLETMVQEVLHIVPDLMFLAVLVVVTRYVLRVIRLFFEAIENSTIRLREFEPAWAKPTYQLVRIGVIALALVVAYPYIPGSDSDAFKGVSIFIGVLASLGSSSLIGNIIAGYTLTYRRTFKTGDRVKIGDHLGDVANIRGMATYLRTPKNEIIVVPNSKIINEEVINYSTLALEEGLILHATVGVGYDAPWRQIEAMLLEAASRTPGLLPKPAPYILQKELGTFAVTYELNVYCDQPRIMGRLYSRLRRSILDVFNEYGVQIMTPAYEGDPDQMKVVPREQWYAAPARPPNSEASVDSDDTPEKDSADPSSFPRAS